MWALSWSSNPLISVRFFFMNAISSPVFVVNSFASSMYSSIFLLFLFFSFLKTFYYFNELKDQTLFLNRNNKDKQQKNENKIDRCRTNSNNHSSSKLYFIQPGLTHSSIRKILPLGIKYRQLAQGYAAQH